VCMAINTVSPGCVAGGVFAVVAVDEGGGGLNPGDDVAWRSVYSRSLTLVVTSHEL